MKKEKKMVSGFCNDRQEYLTSSVSVIEVPATKRKLVAMVTGAVVRVWRRDF